MLDHWFRDSLARLMQPPLPVLDCPSRPGETLSPALALFPPYNADWAPLVAKTDYAVNEGDFITNTRMGAPSLEEGDSPKYKSKDVSGATGVCFLRSEIRPAHVKDGTSNTYLVGEKYVSTTGYDTDKNSGHDQSMYTGVDLDINRWTIEPPLPDGGPCRTAVSGARTSRRAHCAVRRLGAAAQLQHRRRGAPPAGEPQRRAARRSAMRSGVSRPPARPL